MIYYNHLLFEFELNLSIMHLDMIPDFKFDMHSG